MLAKILRTWLVQHVLSVTLFFVLAGPVDAQSLFQNEQTARQHCPSDTVVWLNLPSGIYHFKGQRWYGRTKSGAYACQREADQAGDRATLNGQ
jgi:hypothetical protein